MPIRHSIKALLLRDGALLLNRCRRKDGRNYYDLPGGGQDLYESREEALRRELLEETGYQVRPLRLAAVGEEIYTDPALRERFPQYTHRLFSIYLAELVSETQSVPTEPDSVTLGADWVPLDQLNELPELLPIGLKAALPAILQGEFVNLDTVYMDWAE